MTRLAAALLFCVPVVTQAADVSLVIGGWSHHFVPAQDRDGLNQVQGTGGVELTTTDWDVQATHLTDSFGCGSNQLSASRRWELFQPRPWFRGGFTLGAVAAYRCSAPPVSQLQLVTILRTSGPGGYIGNVNFGPGYTTSCNYTIDNPDPSCTLSQVENVSIQHKKWVYGLVPGVYMELGEWVSFDAVLIRSPWTGHHLVLYGQFSVKVFSF